MTDDQSRDAGAGGRTSAPTTSESRITRGRSKDDDIPQQADDVELVGLFEDSGYKDPPYIARRSDGQVVQVPKLLYQVLEAVDGKRNYAEIAEQVKQTAKVDLGEDDTRALVEGQLRKLGLVAPRAGQTQSIKRVDPMLALKVRTAVIPGRVVHAITTVLYPLFFPPVIVAVVAGLIALDVWLFFSHGVAPSVRETLYQPAVMLLIIGLIVAATAFHEFGHATACRYGGAKPGVIGAGIYIVWPAFYSDVTDAYRLGRWGRLRTDLGGVYFNAIAALALAGAYFATGFEPLLLVVLLMHLEIVHQMMPFLRLDGYLVLSDLTGVPDMFTRIGPILKSLIPGRAASEKVTQLKGWVRVVVSTWVVLLIPVLAYIFGAIALSAPRVYATAWDSGKDQASSVERGYGDGAWLEVTAGAVQLILVSLPVLALSYIFVKIATQIVRGAWARSERRPLVRSGVASLTAGAVVLTAVLMWPSGDNYRPIEPDERGTVQASLVSASYRVVGDAPAVAQPRDAERAGTEANEGDQGRSEAPATTTDEVTTVKEPTTTTSTDDSTATDPTTDSDTAVTTTEDATTTTSDGTVTP